MTKLEKAARQALEALKNQSPDRDMVRAAFALQEALAEQAEQEPVTWMNTNGAVNKLREAGWAMNAAPVRTKDLTDAEIATLLQRNTIDGKIMPFALCEAAIAADREKNK